MHRILSVLVHLGYVDRNAHSEEYSATIKVFQLGVDVKNRLSLIPLVRPYMEGLGNKCEETVNLALFINYHAVVIDRVEILRTLRSEPSLGRDLPAYCTALGKIFLANLEKEKLDRYVNETKLKRFTKKTITSISRLKAELDRIRKEGFSIDDEEFEDGIRCIASPLRDSSGKLLGALSISGPSSRITLENSSFFEKSLASVSAEVSKKLGFQDKRERLFQ